MTIGFRLRAIGSALVVTSISVLLGGMLNDSATAGKRGGRAILHDAAGNRVGVVTLVQRGGRTEVTARVRDLTPSFHGFHVHATGACDPAAPGGAFTSAGGHFNPTGAAHGDHAGDMPTILALDNGWTRLTFETDRFTVGELFDEDGSALIVHAGRDNFANIPTRYHSHTEDTFGPDSATLATGDAGARAACGVITDRRN